MNYPVMGAVAIGGAIGSVARYLVAGWVQSPSWSGFPYGIFIVNVTGGLAMGILTALMTYKFSVSLEIRSFLTVGILGGYTTFSTFSLESVMLIERHDYGQAVAYVAGSALLSIAALFAGLWIVRVIYA